jgi:RNA polymerase sigma-70 factor (ECF subfamily)
LRYAFVDDLSIDRIGEIYGVHRATAARWIGHARDRFEEQLRAALKARLSVSESELFSILRVTMSGIDVSLARQLGGSEKPPLAG